MALSLWLNGDIAGMVTLLFIESGIGCSLGEKPDGCGDHSCGW